MRLIFALVLSLSLHFSIFTIFHAVISSICFFLDRTLTVVSISDIKTYALKLSFTSSTHSLSSVESPDLVHAIEIEEDEIIMALSDREG
jgi:hypothetical protein